MIGAFNYLVFILSFTTMTITMVKYVALNDPFTPPYRSMQTDLLCQDSPYVFNICSSRSAVFCYFLFITEISDRNAHIMYVNSVDDNIPK